MGVMKGIKGLGFTIQFGHLVDRVVIAELERLDRGEGNREKVIGEKERLLQNELPLPFLFAALPLLLHSIATWPIVYVSSMNPCEGMILSMNHWQK